MRETSRNTRIPGAETGRLRAPLRNSSARRRPSILGTAFAYSREIGRGQIPLNVERPVLDGARRVHALAWARGV